MLDNVLLISETILAILEIVETGFKIIESVLNSLLTMQELKQIETITSKFNYYVIDDIFKNELNSKICIVFI